MEFIPAKTIVSRKNDPNWFGADYNMNIYRGCSHGCIYCDSRSDCYRIGDFDTMRAKENALSTIRRDLRSKTRAGVVATGSMSDPYNPLEAEHELTRGALKLLNEYGFGVAVATKSDLVTRDIPLLREIGAHAPVLVKITITTADDDIARKIEPNAPASSARFAALRALSEAGIVCGVLLMPVLPWITDTEANIAAIAEQAADAGARFVYPAFGFTMREGNREYLYARLDEAFPGLRKRYERAYGNNYSNKVPEAAKLWSVCREVCGRRGLLVHMGDIIKAYQDGYGEQLTVDS